MPCNIGYKNFAKAEIPAPVPEKFSAKSKAPAIDPELMEKLGVEDPVFLKWLPSLETAVLLQEALKRTIKKVGDGSVKFSIDKEGMLDASGTFTSAAEKKRLEKKTAQVTALWQFEVLGIVTELLEYTPIITENGDELILEAEEKGKSHPCDYIKVTRKGDNATVCFEHFKSREALDAATAKFLLLAHKLGVKITISRREVTQGHPFPNEIGHTHPHSHSHGHGYHTH